ncbi:MAG TPA: DUF2378 family protein, partial [Myxococcaceae bacterium]|nr:DUF2378 family protein [Myxococcaceae bacterium]
RVTPELKNSLRAVGLDLDRKLLPAYPRQTWVRAVDVVFREAFPALPKDEAARQAGQLATRGFAQTLVGKAAVKVAQWVGPERTLQGLTLSFRASNNYVVATVLERGPTFCRMACTGLDLTPYFMVGVLEATLAFCRVLDPAVTVEAQSGDRAVFRMSWCQLS